MSSIRKGNNYSNIATNTTSTLKTGTGTLKRIIVNKAVASGVITIYDNTSATGTKIATITHPATLLQTNYFLEFDVYFSTGLTVVTSSTDDITVVYV